MSLLQLIKGARRLSRPLSNNVFTGRTFTGIGLSRNGPTGTSSASAHIRCLAACYSSNINLDRDRAHISNTPLQSNPVKNGNSIDLLLHLKEELPDNLREIYSSPLQILQYFEEHHGAKYPFQTKAISINVNGTEERWFTSTVTHYSGGSDENRPGEPFSSGKFGDFIKTYSSDELFFKTIVVDCNVYYSTEQHAKQAAAARCIDYSALRTYTRWRHRNPLSMPLRYCVEEPIVLKNRYGSFSNSPQYDFACTMQQKHGPVEISYRIQTEQFECEGGLQNWYSASCIDPITSEEFRCGVFSANVSSEPECLPYSNSAPLYEEAIRIQDGIVYYQDENVAKHAAAARALDCFNFRNIVETCINDSSGVAMKHRMCLEEPYMMGEEDQHALDYEQIENIVADRRLNPKRESAYTSLIRSMYKDSSWLHVPVSLFNRIFELLGTRPPNYHYLVCHESTESTQEWYTSTVTDPITGEEFHSGLICQEVVDAKKRRVGTLKIPLHMAEVMISGQRVYYKGKKLAEHAAAARAIDCYVLRSEVNMPRVLHLETAPRIQLCMEDPYKDANDRDAQLTDYNELLKKRNAGGKYDPAIVADPILLKEENEVNHHDPEFFQRAFDEMLDNRSYLLHVPSKFLHNIFSKNYFHGGSSLETKIETISKDERDWHTATIVDPLTDEKFHSGLIGHEVKVDKKVGNTLRTPLHLAEVMVSDQRVYYCNDPRLAVHAAAARAIDCYIFRGLDDSIDDAAPRIQLCMENPYKNAHDRDLQTVDYEALLSQRSECMVTTPDEDACSVNDTVGFALENHNEASRGHNKLSTMGRIADIWTKDQNQVYGNAEKSGSPFKKVSPQMNLDNILAWYKRANKNPTKYDDAIALADLCKRVLVVLAKCNNEQKGSISNSIDITREGKDIWDKLCVLQSDFGASLLDIDTCNSYIGCLNSSDAASAMTAEALLMSMVNQEEYGDLKVVPPHPNVDTYNAVMSLWSVATGPDRKVGVNRVYTLLEDAFLNKTYGEIRPNIDTFKTLIAINSKNDDGTFSYNNAKSCLDMIQQLSDRSNDKSLLPNSLAIYNAALMKTTSTTHGYKPSWLSRGQAFDGGFVHATESSNREGLEVEKWFLLMDTNKILGDVDTFESVIQAWVDTGTLDGLLRAEFWAKKFLEFALSKSNNDFSPRLETFQPIIAAWALCGDERSPARIADWIHQLTYLSKTVPRISPDANILVAKLIAIRRYQASVINRCSVEAEGSISNEQNIVKEVELAFHLAQNCGKFLQDILSENTNYAGLIESEAFAPIFVNCIEAWGDASHIAKQMEVNNPALNSMLGVREMIKISHLADSHQSKAFLVEQEENRCNKHAIKCIGEIYSSIVRQLNQLDSTSSMTPDQSNNQNLPSSFFGERIADVERMLRNYEYKSRLSIEPSDSEMKAARLGFYEDVLRGCSSINTSSDYGNVIRICFLIIEHLAWSKKRRIDEFTIGGNNISNLFAEIVSIACKCVVHPQEKKRVLTKIFDDASNFFDHGKQDTKQFGVVDKASLIGAIRTGLADFDATDTESFLIELEQRASKQKRPTDYRKK